MSAVGLLVRPSGRLHLREAEEPAAAAAIMAAWVARGEQFYRPASDTLADIALEAAAAITRDGDWIEFAHDDGGDPKWNHQATAFYVAIAPFVRSGTVRIEGEDGSTWSYTYADGQISQRGWNGWDGSIEPFGDAVDYPDDV